MLPLYNDDEKRRKRMNLGGAATASHDQILQNARQVREQRAQQRAKEDSALFVQSLWRGSQARMRFKQDLRTRVDSDPASAEALRCLALLGNDWVRMARWASLVLGRPNLIDMFRSLDVDWMDHIMVIVSSSAAESAVYADSDPQSCLAIFNLVKLLLQLPEAGIFAARLLNLPLHLHLKAALLAIPIEAKNSSPVLPVVADLSTALLPFFPRDSEQYRACVALTLFHILTVPLLPYRLPIPSLSSFSARAPLNDLDLLLPEEGMQPFLTLEKGNAVHLLANLTTLMTPRYNNLRTSTLERYFDILMAALSVVPGAVFAKLSRDDPKRVESQQMPWNQAENDDSDDDMEEYHPFGPAVQSNDGSQNQSGERAAFLEFANSIDNRTRNRLRAIGSPKHISALYTVTPTALRPNLYGILAMLMVVWPANKSEVIPCLLSLSGLGIIRELYRNTIRSSPLGKEMDAGEASGTGYGGSSDRVVSVFEDLGNRDAWVALMLVVELYSHTLLTMGDDEFFASRGGVPQIPPSSTGFILGSSSGASSSAMSTGQSMGQRNPLTIDEVVAFSRQLMNIAFTLYMNEKIVLTRHVPGMSSTWEDIRAQVTKLLQAIHARDSRRPFTPLDHWLFSSQINMNSFVEAAVLDDESVTESDLFRTHLLRNRTRSGQQTSMKKLIAHLSPRLGVLNNIPFAIPFETRVQIFRMFVDRDMARSQANYSRDIFDEWREYRSRRTEVTIRRDNVAHDGFNKLNNVDLKRPITVTFIDQFGNEEAGIDGGGVFKEFFTTLCMEVLDTNRGLWLATTQNELYPNPHSYARERSQLEWYKFIGRMMGRAMYQGILVDVAFAGFFLSKWLGRQSYLDDLASLDPELYKNLLFLKNYVGDPEDLSLTFAIAEDDLGISRTIDLIPNGSNIPVTRENRLRFIILMSHYRLTKQIRLQSNAFFDGLSELIDPKWIRMFNQQELQILIGGINAPIDLEDLRNNTNYGGLFDDGNPVVQRFWKVVESFTQEQRRALLRFATSCSRPPLLGFKELSPKFAIRDAGADQERLPTASTCFNLLKLPLYTDERVLKTKLLQAITSGAGFDLS